jgi:hypothetical protein
MTRLRENIGYRVLKRKKKGTVRVKQVHNFDTASTAVILFDTSIPDAFQVVKEFRKFLDSHQIRSAAFGYVHEKEVPQEMLFWKNFSFITRSNINWYRKPSGEPVDHFYSNNPDLLVDFTRDMPLELQYLVQLSQASFKIGVFTEEENDYDLMLQLSEEQDMHFFAEQVKHYVSILQSSHQPSDT